MDGPLPDKTFASRYLDWVVVFLFKDSIFKIGYSIMRGALKRLSKPTKENGIGVLLAVIAIFYTAYLHDWSRQTLWTSIWESVFAPCLLTICVLLMVHIVQAAREIHRLEGRPFQNALGRTLSIAPWQVRWRCHLITAIYLIVPIALFCMILKKSPTLLLNREFVVNQNTQVFMPDLHSLNNIPYQPPKEKDKSPRLFDLFTEDYPADMKAQNELTMKGILLPLKQQVYLDYLGNSKFVGFYIPEKDPVTGGETTTVICKALTGQVQPMLLALEKNLYMEGGLGIENARKIPDLKFTQQVVIYHESMLSILEKAEIIEAFKAKEITVQFRGPDYESYRRNIWSQNRKDNP
jgi:hypothetical protein